MAGLKSLNSRTDLHISKSDKYGDFVVSQRDSYREVTLHHINSNPDKYLPPKRKEHSLLVDVRRPTDISVFPIEIRLTLHVKYYRQRPTLCGQRSPVLMTSPVSSPMYFSPTTQPSLHFIHW